MALAIAQSGVLAAAQEFGARQAIGQPKADCSDALAATISYFEEVIDCAARDSATRAEPDGSCAVSRDLRYHVFAQAMSAGEGEKAAVLPQ